MKKTLIVAIMVTIALPLLAGEEIIRRGAALSDQKAVALADVVANPKSYEKDAVIVEGTIQSACTNKGCWMQMTADKVTRPVRVTFKDYGFFVPKDSKGMQAKAEGVTRVKTLSKEDADHLEAEGVKLTRNADGTATEVSFIASGVELTKK